jgi:hypothetical protein
MRFRISRETNKQKGAPRLAPVETWELRTPPLPTTVILSAVASSRSEEATQSKDPQVSANPNNAEGNSEQEGTLNHESTAPAVILRQRSPWQSQGLPTKDLCTFRLSPRGAARHRPRALKVHGVRVLQEMLDSYQDMASAMPPQLSFRSSPRRARPCAANPILSRHCHLERSRKIPKCRPT